MDIRMSNIATPMPQIRAKFTSKLGFPLSGCKVYTYEPDSDIPKTTWLDIDKTTENTNPILLDAAGEADIFLDGLYRIVVKDRFGFVVYDVKKTGSDLFNRDNLVITWSGRTQESKNKDTINALDFNIISSNSVDQLAKLNSLFAYAAIHGANVKFPANYDLYINANNGVALSIPSGVSVFFNSAKIYIDYASATANSCFDSLGRQAVTGFELIFKTGSNFRRALSINGNSYFRNWSISSQDAEIIMPVSNKRDSTVQLSGRGIVLENYEISGVSHQISLYDLTENKQIYIKNGIHRNYIQGIQLAAITASLDNIRFFDVSSTAPTAHLIYNAGQNPIVGNSNKLSMTNIFIDGSCEHGIYLSTVRGESLMDVELSNINIKGTQQSALKVRGATNLSLSNFNFTDAANYTTPNVNEDGLHLENCWRVTATGGFIGRSDGTKNTGYAGIFLSAVKHAQFKAITIFSPYYAGVYFAEVSAEYSNAKNSDIDLSGVTVVGPGTTGVYMAANSALEKVNMDVTVLDCSGPPIVNASATAPVNCSINLKTNYVTNPDVMTGEAGFNLTCTLLAPTSSSYSQLYSTAFRQTGNFVPTTSKRNAVTALLSDYVAAIGAYGAAIDFRTGTRRKAAIATVQTGASENQQGLAFFVTNSTSTTDTVFEAARITQSEISGGGDATQNLGRADLRFNNTYLAVAPTVSSDERLKQQFRSQSESEKLAAIEIKNSICLYKFNDAVDLKGDGARWHVGVKAQQVVLIMQSHGLNPFDYGFVCFDEWAELPQIIDDYGDLVQTYRAAGSQFAIRYEELWGFILAAI